MTHWGWYWKVKRQHKPKALCNNFAEIDSFDLFKTDGLVRILVTNNGDKKEAVYDGSKLEVTTSGGVTYSIPTWKKPCHFGGFQYFFRCPNPSCNRGMRKLYHFMGLFLCRKCWKLGYFTQRLRPSRRLHEMQNKIEKKLKDKGGSVERKPKWMRWPTFEKMRGKHFEYDVKATFAVEEEIERFYGNFIFLRT